MIRLKEPAKAKPAAKPPARKPVAKAKKANRVAWSADQIRAEMLADARPLQRCPSCNGTGKRPVPMTAAERKRRSRAKLRAAV